MNDSLSPTAIEISLVQAQIQTELRTTYLQLHELLHRAARFDQGQASHQRFIAHRRGLKLKIIELLDQYYWVERIGAGLD
jgi:hypothetical protein